MPGPDLTVIFQQTPSAQPILFNIEVTQFCLTNDEVNYYNIKKEIVKRIEVIPSGLKFALFTISQDENSLCELVVQPDFVNRLISNQENIIRYIQDIIQTEKEKLSDNVWVEYPIPGFENDLYLRLYKPSKSSQGIKSERTRYYGGFDHVLYTQNEYEKIVRKILKDKLKQMIENTINLLVIISDSPTYDVVDFEPAFDTIRDKVIQKDHDFFVNEMDIKGGITEFLERYKRLSGLLFIDSSREEGMLLRNSQSDAHSQLPEIIVEYLMKVREILFRDKREIQRTWEKNLREKILSQNTDYEVRNE